MSSSEMGAGDIVELFEVKSRKTRSASQSVSLDSRIWNQPL